MPQTDNDNDCVSMCLDGRPEAYKHLVARYEAPLVSYLAGRLHDRLHAEETAEEAFVRAFLSLAALRKRESFFPWLVGIADRVLKEDTRKARRQFELADDVADGLVAPGPAPDYDLERLVAQLHPPFREVVLLRFYGGLSCREISERLGVPVGSVTKSLSRAYGVLRESLKRSGETRPAREVHT